MSDSATKKMISAFNKEAPTSLFLTSLFQARPENYHNSEEVEVDIMRSGEDVAIVVVDPSTGYRMNQADLYTNKSFKPPMFKEAVPINAFSLLKREFGDNPFADRDFQAKATVKALRSARKVENKIIRSIELQASQILQTGVITFIDASGNTLYTLDYQAKSAHFPTAGTTWGAGGADPLNDLESLAEVIRNNGQVDVDQIIMGSDAWEEFVQDSRVLNALDNRRLNIGAISPMAAGGTSGGNYRGTLDLGNYKVDVWTYGGRYKHPSTGTVTQYLDPAKVIMRHSAARMDASFGGIPKFNNNSPALTYLPRRFRNRTGRS